MKHKFLGADVPCDCDKDGHCMICDGGLSHCVVCHGAESDLPTDCTGKQMTTDQRIGVANGDDFKDGKWSFVYPHG